MIRAIQRAYFNSYLCPIEHDIHYSGNSLFGLILRVSVSQNAKGRLRIVGGAACGAGRIGKAEVGIVLDGNLPEIYIPMKNIKHIAVGILLLIITGLHTTPAAAQSEVLTNIKSAIKIGSSKELSQYFNSTVELGFEGIKSNHSQTQAEFILKDFFNKTPASGFEYIHQGSSPEGLQYAIGKYTYGGGSYRVVIYIKHLKGNYVVDMIDFARE